MTDAGLRRAILINSYQRQKMFSEFDFDSPTQLTGDNGAGKTSLLRLIPFFYGATGTQIVRKSNVNKSFAEWYLPNSNSYIIFEFVTARGQIAHVICYRNQATKGGIVYLFVKGEFDPSVIIKRNNEGKADAIVSSKLVAELVSEGFEPESRITSVKEYREIIQNINSGTRSNKFLAYSLCSGRHDVRHVEKITAALIQGEFNMADTKALFLDILEQGNSVLEFGVDSNKIEQWCSDYIGIAAFLAKKETFECAIANNKLITHLTNRLSSALFVIKNASEELAKSLSAIKREQDEFNEENDNELEAIREKQSEVELSRNSLKNAINSLGDEIDAQHEKLIDYENADYPELSIKLAQLPEMEDKLAHQKSNYEALETKVSDAKGKRDHDLQNLESKYNKEQSQLARQELDAQKDFQAKIEEVNSLHQKQSNELTSSQTDLLDEKHKTHADYKEQLAVLQQRLKNPDIDKALVEQQESLEKLKSEYQDQVIELNDRIRDTEKERIEFNNERGVLLGTLEQVRITKRNAEEKLALVNERLDPDSGTLFSFLESNRSGWQASPLGRVLSEKLLMDTRLAPSITDYSDSVFELNIDTSNLPDCKVTNQDDIQEQVRLMDLIEELEDQEEEVTNQLKKNENSTNEVDTLLTLLQAQLQNTKNDVTQTSSNLENKKLEIIKAREVLSEQISHEIKYLTKSVSLIGDEIKIAEERYQSAKQELDNDRLTQVSNIESEHASVTATLAELQDKSKASLIENKARIRTEYEQRLSEDGISREIYQRYKEDIEQLEDQIKTLQQRSNKIRQYEEWLSVYKVRDPRQREERNEKVKEFEAASQEAQNLHNTEKELRQIARTRNQYFRESIKSLENQKARTDSAKNRLTDFDEVEVKEDSLNYSGDLSSLLGEIESQLPKLEKLLKQRKKDIHQMEAITLGLGDGELYRFWNETSSNAIEGEVATSECKRIEILEKIMTDIIPQVTRITVESAVNMGRMLVDFKDRLLGFDRDIKILGRNISEQVRDNNTFSVVGSVDINVESTLSKLQGWQDVINFSEIYDEWDRTGAAELPTKEFYNALSTLTYHINSDKVKNTTELFDIKFEVIENNQKKIAKTDKDMRDLASNGTNLLIQSMLYLALLTQQRGVSKLAITYPTDEIGKLTAENQAKLLKMMGANGFKVVAAQPDGNNRTANLFKNLYHLTHDKNIFNKPKVSKLAKAKAKAVEVEGEVE